MKLETLIKKPVSVFLVTAALLLAGLLQLTNLPIKLYPNTNKTRISVRIPHPSMTAEVFEAEFSQIMTDAIATIDGVDEVETTFSNGSTRILVWFEWDISGEDARSRVSVAMSQVQAKLPEESDDLEVRYWAGRSSGFYSVAAFSEEMTSKEVFDLLEPKVRPRLNKLKNVDIARINPVEETRVEIILDPLSLQRHGLTPDDVATSVRQNYRDLSLGSYRSGRDSYSVRIGLNVKQFSDIENIIVGTSMGARIHLSDIADVEIQSGLPRRLYSVNGKSAVIIFAMPNQDGNIRDLAAEVNAIVDDLKPNLPSHLVFQKLVDPGEYINSAIKNVIFAGLIGGALAILIVFLFLGEPRNTIMVAVSIPFATILSFLFLKSFDVTINLISLSGLALAVGMIVDSSIVVVENIFRHLRQQDKDESTLESIVNAVSEVRGAIIASTITTVVVFLPVGFTAKLTSAILGDLSQAVVFVVFCSCLVALIVTPAIASAVFAKNPRKAFHSKLTDGTKAILAKLVETYQNVLGYLLATRTRSLLTITAPLVVLVLLTIFAAPKIRREIMAKPDSPRISLDFENLNTTEPEELLKAIAPIEKKIIEKYGDKIDNLFARIAGSKDGVFTLSMKSTELREQAMMTLQEDFPSDETWKFEVERWDPAELPLPKTFDLRLSFFGSESNVLADLMRKSMEILEEADLYGKVRSNPSTVLANYIVLDPKHEVIGSFDSLGLSKLSSIGRVALTGRSVIEMTHNDEPMKIDVSYPEGKFQKPSDVLNFLVNTPHGGIPLKHFFNAKLEQGLPEIVYLDADRIFEVTADLRESTPKWQRPQIEEQAKQLIKEKLALPPGYSYEFSDTQTEINSAILSLVYSLILSFLLIYVVLGAQFNSFVAPVVIMLSVPMGLVGVILSLYLAESTISLNSMLGSILLGGIGVNNSILIYDFFLQVREKFSDHKQALIHTCGLRIVPIIITSLTTVLGMMPIAFAMGDGTNVIQPLGIAIAGGLGIATILTLFVVPCALNLFAIKSTEA